MNLCRTPRWRNFLLSPRARTIWAAVRRCAGLPSLTGFSEIKFAVLVFGRACWVSFSLSSGGNAVHPQLLTGVFGETRRARLLLSHPTLPNVPLAAVSGGAT